MQTFLTVSYIGSKTSHLDNNISNFNSPDPATNTDINSRRPWQAYMSVGEGTRPFGLGEIRYLDSYANGSYHGLQTSVEKRYSHGLVAGLSYTYSKSIGEGYERNGGFTYQDPRNRRADRMRYPFDVTHNAVLHYVYEMPFLNRFRGVAGAFLAGWQTNGILRLSSGFYLTPTVGPNNLNTGGFQRADVAPGCNWNLDNPTPNLLFNPGCFSIPAQYAFGNAGRGIIQGPGTRNLDFSLFRNFYLSKGDTPRQLQLRGEMFNLTNTPQFNNPNTTIGVANTGIITSAGSPRSFQRIQRQIQVAAKFTF